MMEARWLDQRSLTILTAALLIMAFYLSLAPGYPNSPSDLNARDRFVRGDLPATAYLNDLGVADVNDDALARCILDQS